MVKVDIPYYIIVKGRGYWRTTPAMRAAGFATIRCGKDGPAAWRVAAEWNARWQAHRSGAPHPGIEATPSRSKRDPAAIEAAQAYPKGSAGEAFQRYRGTDEWTRKAPATRDDWWRGWRHIRPVFGDLAPAGLELDTLSAWRAKIETEHGRREAHRALKIWRALWKVMAALGYCGRDQDPSLAVRNSAAKGRSDTWSEGEAVLLAKDAWRAGYRGLAVAIAVLWDSQLSPVDVRTLSMSQLKRHGRGAVIRDRTKTDEPAGGKLSARTLALIEAYLAGLGYQLLEHTPLIRSKGLEETTRRGGRPRAGVPYTKNSIGADFRIVRAIRFGDAEKRQLQDLRRSGAVEAIVGGATAEQLSHGMGNTLAASNALFETYVPRNVATLTQIAEARLKGRSRMRSED